MSNDSDTPTKPRSFWRAVGKGLGILLRLILVLIFGVLLGVGIYYGIPALYHATIVPIQQNTVDIVVLGHRIDQVEDNIDGRAEVLQDRDAELEGELAALQENSAVQESAVSTAMTQLADLQPRIEDLEETQSTQATEISDLEKALEKANRDLAAQQATLDALTLGLDDLETQLADTTAESTENLERLTTEQTHALGRLALLQAAQDLLKARLQLLEDNPGAAQASLAIVAEHLTHASVWWPDIADDASQWTAETATLATLIAERSFQATPLLEALWAEIAAGVLPPLPEGTKLLSTPSTTTDMTPTTTISPTTMITITPTLTATTTLTVTETPTTTSPAVQP